MKLDSIRKLLRVLFVILGAGIGAALAATAIGVGRTSNPDLDMNPSGVLLIYMLGVCLPAGTAEPWTHEPGQRPVPAD